jgi:hypothetical protein
MSDRSKTNQCPSEEELISALYDGGVLNEGLPFDGHLDRCEECRLFLKSAELTRLDIGYLREALSEAECSIREDWSRRGNATLTPLRILVDRFTSAFRLTPSVAFGIVVTMFLLIGFFALKQPESDRVLIASNNRPAEILQSPTKPSELSDGQVQPKTTVPTSAGERPSRKLPVKDNLPVTPVRSRLSDFSDNGDESLRLSDLFSEAD